MTWGSSGDVGAPVAMRTSFNALSAMHTPVFNGRDVSAFAFRGVAKTRKAAAKRFKVTSGGKVLSKQAGKQHLNTKMSRKNKMRLGDKRVIEKADISNVQGCLPHVKLAK
eukprot:CAMPEP_0185251422 /NCGR_PEP_ID=MMETSP1359-20130426/833_1 /TAXON_ID=552665 /ORGANISM="Bigelowiella longifila, Strain CCMP242" /LENGTH=109 /DNA_ID=CAMNT_0027833323 /DNA_START=132 /DNA_END=461 /DNA_ORIENTATION=+